MYRLQRVRAPADRAQPWTVTFKEIETREKLAVRVPSDRVQEIPDPDEKPLWTRGEVEALGDADLGA